MNQRKHVTLYTDGACSGNPGKGGYGAILEYKGHEKELSAGYAVTTNNRMEILAAVAGLELLKEPCDVTLYSDSKYLVDAVNQGWIAKWSKNGWYRTKTEKAKNEDLFRRLLVQLKRHHVEFLWVKGHAGHPQNERCDALATGAIKKDNLLIDEGYTE